MVYLEFGQCHALHIKNVVYNWSEQTMKSGGWDNKHLLTQHYVVNNLFCMKKVQNFVSQQEHFYNRNITNAKGTALFIIWILT